MAVVSANEINSTHGKEIPRGKPVSGRTWKTPQKERFSSMRRKGTKVMAKSWELKQEKKIKLNELKALQQEIKDRRQQEKDAKREAREAKEKRRQENELKSTTVQVLSRTHKLKTMSKKQLRNIKKTIVNKNGVVEYVPVYSK